MKVVIVGAGASGLLHALAFRAANVEVGYVYDPDVAKALGLAEAMDALPLRTFEEAITSDAEIAAVCSPPARHVAQAEALSGPGRVVFVEKPVATSMAELERLAALPRCVPILQWRAGRALRALKRAIAHGHFGDAPTVACDLAWGRDDRYLATRGEPWGCGALLSIGIHALDAISWALGAKVAAASGLFATRDGAVFETAAHALFRFDNDSTASFRISLDGGADATRLMVCGHGVSATIEGSEADPTAGVVRWSALDRIAHDRLVALEHDTPGATGSPLLVPYIGQAVRALLDGQDLPSIADTFDAHSAALVVTKRARDAA
jgi:predicted dehydrogenase